MFKTFIAGILLGVAGAGAILYFIPAVNQAREQSLIVVHPNHGNTETFHVNIPMDRVMVGIPGQPEPLPAGLEWPDDELFAGTRAELFKLRNSKDAVVGIASRLAASDENVGDTVEWVMHLPARGSAYIQMEATPREGGFRLGDLATGTREFAPLTGRVTERWIANTTGLEDAPAGKIEIITAFVSREFDGEYPEPERPVEE
jgi:hypothetical protein